MTSRHLLLTGALLLLVGCVPGIDSPTDGGGLVRHPGAPGWAGDEGVAGAAGAGMGPGLSAPAAAHRLQVRSLAPVTMAVFDVRAVPADGPPRYLSFKSMSGMDHETHLVDTGVSEPIPVVCACPGGRRVLALGLALEFQLDLAARRGRMSAVAQLIGDWNGDGTDAPVRRFSSDVSLVLREDEILGANGGATLRLVAAGGGTDVQWMMRFEWTGFEPASGGGEFRLESLGYSKDYYPER